MAGDRVAGSAPNGEIRRGHPAYPTCLTALHDPPAQLYARGVAPTLLGRPAVAVVGSRSCSAYGRSVAGSIGRALAAAGVVVVSGLAQGIDAAAHRGALDSSGATLAVLGCGIELDYPLRNRALAEQIRDRGLVVSEYPAATAPARWRFPARNRIIAGLSLATVVVEAGERSGALITAEFALDMGRDVFAVPGEITSSRAAGTNALLREGATPVTSVPELLRDLGLEPAGPERGRAGAAHLTGEEERVLAAVRERALTLDELGRRLGIDQAALAASVARLELAGVVNMDNGHYRPAV